MRPLLAGLLIAVSLLMPVERVHAQICADRCTAPPAAGSGERVYTVDASVDGQKRQDIVPRGVSTKLRLVRMNPFKYRYTVNQEVVELNLAIIGGFLGTAAGGAGLNKLGMLTSRSERPGATFPGAGSEVDNAYTGYEKGLNAWKVKHDAAVDALKQIQDAAKQFEVFYKATDLDSLPDCETICAKISETSDALLVTLTATEKKKTVEELNGAKSALDILLKALEAELDKKKKDEAISADTKLQWDKILEEDVRKPLAEFLAKVQARQDDAKRILDPLIEKKNQIDSLRTQLLSPWKTWQDFAEPAGGDKNVKWTVIRQDSRDPNAKPKTVALVSVDMGEARVAVSVGYAVSSVSNDEVGQVISSDGKGGTATKFDYTSKGRPLHGFTTLLHTKVWHPKFWRLEGTSWGPSLGLMGNLGGGEFRPGALLGLSVGMADNWVWLTGGLHVTTRKELQGFAIGDTVPAAIGPTVPTVNRPAAGAFFSLSFRIR